MYRNIKFEAEDYYTKTFIIAEQVLIRKHL